MKNCNQLKRAVFTVSFVCLSLYKNRVERTFSSLECDRRNVARFFTTGFLLQKILLAFLLTGGVLMYIYYAAADVSSGLIRHMDGLLELIYGLLPENFPNPETAHDVVMWLAARRWLPLDLDR